MTKTKSILIADDHTLFRNGLRLLLEHYLPGWMVIEAENGNEAIWQTNQRKPDVILMDINMPLMNGIEATKKIMECHPEACIIALTMHGDESYHQQMIEAGAKGFLLKNSSPDEVILAIEKVCDGKYYFSEGIMYSLIRNLKQEDDTQIKTSLTARESEILQLICSGFSNQEIGEKLFISKRTVDNYRANLLEKTQSRNTAQLVMFAIKWKLIEL